MTTKVSTRTTLEVTRSLEPIYTGGEISSNASGSLIATTVDDEILVVELRTGKPLLRLDGDGESVTSLCLSPTSSHLVVCSRSLSMSVYALIYSGTYLEAKLLRTIKPHTSPVVSSTIDVTGSLFVSGGADGVVKVWDLQRGHCSHTFHGHGGLVTAVKLFESPTTLKRQVSTSKKRKSRGDKADVTATQVSGSTIVLASGGEDGRIKLWDLSTKKNFATLESHVSVVRTIQWSVEQQLLLSAGRDKTMVIWDPQTWQPQRIVPALEVLEAAGFVHDGSFCYAAGENGRLRLWDTQSGQETIQPQKPGLESEAILSIVSVPNEDAILTVHLDQTLILHSTEPLRDVLGLTSIRPLPVIRRISGNLDEVIDMVCIGPQRDVLALATNTESVRIVSAQEAGVTTAFGSDLTALEGHQDIIICLDIDWSGHWLATGAKDNTARLWRVNPDTSTYECVASFAGHAESLGAICLPKAPQPNTPYARDPLHHPPPYLITGSQDKTIKKWDTSKLEVSKPRAEPYNVAKTVFTRVAHDKDINAMDLSPASSLLATASQDKTIKIWSVDDGSTTAILKGHKRGVWSIQFSPHGLPPLNLAEGGQSGNRGLLVSGSGDRTVKVWSLSTYTCLSTFEGHSNSVLKVIWLPAPISPTEAGNGPTGRPTHTRTLPMIASASSDTLVKLWDPYVSSDSDPLLATLDNHTDRVWSLATPQHRSQSATDTKLSQNPPSPSYVLISGGADATVRFYNDITTATALAQSKHLTERIEQDQLLQNHIHARHYRESITLALSLNHPGRLLKIFEQVTNIPASSPEFDADSITGVQAVDDVLASLSQRELYILLERVRDWNTNARTSPVAQRILHVLLKRYPAQTWTDMARNQRKLLDSTSSEADDASSGTVGSGNNHLTTTTGTDGLGLKARRKYMSMRDLFRALEVYTERHYKRIEELVDESYLLDYTLREMDNVSGSAAVTAGGKANGVASSLVNGLGPAVNGLVLESAAAAGDGDGDGDGGDVIMLE